MSNKQHKIRLLYFSIRYTRIRQLVARLRLLLKRKILSRIASDKLKRRTALVTNSGLMLQEQLPLPVFPPRDQFLVSAAPLTLKFLNVERQFPDCIDWRPDDLKVGTRLWLLNLHYMEFLESLDDANTLRIMKHWINNNRPYDTGYWLDNWNCYSMSIRVVVWMQQISIRKDAFDKASLALISSSLVAQMRFLVSNLELDIGGNHLIKNIKALLWASQFFAGDEAKAWGNLGLKLLKRELSEQIENDGMHYELSPAYHCQVFAVLLDCYKVMFEGECKERLRLELEKMVQVVSDFTHPDGKISLFNDGGLNMAYLPSQCIKAYEDLFAVNTEKNSIINYTDSGYFGLNSLDETIIFDAGNLAPDYLPAHGHGDALAFEWSIKGRRVVIDPGVHEYNAGQWREYSRATKSHNTVTLDGHDQSEFWHAFRVGRRAKIVNRKVHITDEGIQIDATHTGYQRLAGSPLHRRMFIAKLGCIQIRDFVMGGMQQVAVSRIMLHPDCHVMLIDDQKAIIQLDNMKIVCQSNRQISIEDCWCFMDFGEKYQTKQLCVQLGSAPCTGEILIKYESID